MALREDNQARDAGVEAALRTWGNQPEEANPKLWEAVWAPGGATSMSARGGYGNILPNSHQHAITYTS